MKRRIVIKVESERGEGRAETIVPVDVEKTNVPVDVEEKKEGMKRKLFCVQ